VRKGKTTGEGLKKEVRESLTGVTLVILVGVTLVILVRVTLVIFVGVTLVNGGTGYSKDSESKKDGGKAKGTHCLDEGE
jgi:hypothetical protein